MNPPRKRFGNKVRTAKDRRAALVRLLNCCRPEMLPTFTAEGLAQTHGVPANDCAAMLEEARERRTPALCHWCHSPNICADHGCQNIPRQEVGA